MLKNTSASATKPTAKSNSKCQSLSFDSYAYGFACEARVIEHYENKNYKLLAQRYKTPFAEVDLLLRNCRGHLVAVEVKSLGEHGLAEYRLSRQQRMRLIRAHEYLQNRWNELVEFHLVFVNYDGSLQIFEDGFLL